MMNRSKSGDRPASVFVGSSSERVDLCRYLQRELQAAALCEVTLWTQGVFRPSGYSLDSLLEQARRSDFAVLVASPDDAVTRRGESLHVARDNVIFELGLFFGVLGRERTFILADRSTTTLHLPSDLAGLTWLPYERRYDGNESAAVGPAALSLAEQIKALGIREHHEHGLSGAAVDHHAMLQREIERVCANAVAQGWRVKTNSPTTLRLVTPRGRRHSFSIEEGRQARLELRRFVGALRADGLRVNRSVRRAPVDRW